MGSCNNVTLLILPIADGGAVFATTKLGGSKNGGLDIAALSIDLRLN